MALADAEAALFLGASPAAAEACRAKSTRRDQVACLVELRYADDPQASALAASLYLDTGSVAGLAEEAHTDGGYRGKLHFVPERPVGAERRHLGWVLSAMKAFQADLASVRAAAKEHVNYRADAVLFRFFRSVRARTPSAYASSWSVGYNLAGSLHASAKAVEETLWHELFHLNDQEHGGWSERVLRSVYDRVVARCGQRTACLGPYSPGDTMVKGGTYYSFHLDNGPGEYAAELAVRYLREQRAALAGTRLPKAAFKCGPAENAEAWSALVTEFFGGADRVAPCASPTGAKASAPTGSR